MGWTAAAQRRARPQCDGWGSSRPTGITLPRPVETFDAAAIETAGAHGYVLIRDTTCRLFGYHGLVAPNGAFSLDHMFGF